MAEVLIKNGADLNAHNNEGHSILRTASLLGILFDSESIFTYFILSLSLAKVLIK